MTQPIGEQLPVMAAYCQGIKAEKDKEKTKEN